MRKFTHQEIIMTAGFVGIISAIAFMAITNGIKI